MNAETEKILEHYLTSNKVAVTLEPADRDLLKKLLYDFINAKNNFIYTSMLLAYCSQTLTSKQSFSKDLAKISNRALEMILNKDEDYTS